ncbi:hypothetical protein ABIF70_008435 [Bradyrhizobium japonicum]
MTGLHDHLHGLWLPLVTPFRDGALDERSLRRLTRHYSGQAIDGFIPPRVTSNSSGCGQSNSSTREAGQGTVSLSLFPGQELQRLL